MACSVRRAACGVRRAAPAAAERAPGRPRASLRTMEPHAALPLVALLALLPGGAASAACNLTQFSAQLDGLLSTYDREWPPATPARVSLALDPRHATISEPTGTVRMLVDCHMSWEDLRLSWNSSEGGCDRALVSAERLWRPDVGVLSAATARDADDVGLRAQLTAAGHVSWVARLDLEAPVALDLTAWPSDRHQIVVEFGSRSHFEDEIELTVTTVEAAAVFETGSWELVSVVESTTEWERAGGETRVARYVLTLRRRAPAHALAARAVLAGVALLLLAAALLPPPTRAPLCAAASFTAALWLASAVPRVDNAIGAPRVLAALGALCACGGATAAAAALALRLARCTLPAPHAMRRLRDLPLLLRIFTSLEVQGGEESGAWLAAAQLLDALCVLALLVAVLLTALLLVVLA